MPIAFRMSVCCVLLNMISVGAGLGFADDDWPQFRGHRNSGIGTGAPPTRWDLETGENVAWRKPIPGLAHSCPVVADGKIYLTTATSEAENAERVSTGFLGGSGSDVHDESEWTWKLLCLRLSDGELEWSHDLFQGKPQIRRHLKGSHANATPAVSGDSIVVFLGSEGLHCFGSDGKRRWKTDFGKLHSGPYDAPELEWGFGSSPIIYKRQIILQCDCLNTQFVAVVDLETGDEIRRIPRQDVASWSTPLVVDHPEGALVVCNGYQEMAAYRLADGTRTWWLKNGGDVPVPSPIHAGGLTLITNAHGRSPVFAIADDASGELTPQPDQESPDGLKWWEQRAGSYIPTPIVFEDILYVGDDSGRLSVRDLATGELFYRRRVGKGSGTYTASPVAANGHLYFLRENGDVFVIAAGKEYELIAENQMDQIIMATPAIAGDSLLIRTDAELFCLRNQPKP